MNEPNETGAAPIRTSHLDPAADPDCTRCKGTGTVFTFHGDEDFHDVCDCVLFKAERAAPATGRDGAK